MKNQKKVTVFYGAEEDSAARIIHCSFDVFLKKELQNVEKRLPAAVQ